MQLGRVIGRVVATIKDPHLEGMALFIVQGLDEKLQSTGTPFVAVDVARCCGPEDVVYIVFKRDAAIALGDQHPVDATIVGYVDEVAVEDVPDGRLKIYKPTNASK